MAEARVEIEIAKPVDDVWGLVGDFGSIGDWMPGVESCRVDGDDRILGLMGLEVIERLERRDDDAHELVYRIVGGIPVENHRAVVTVSPAGAGSKVTWDFEVAPDEMAPLLQGAYEQALGTLKDKLGG